MGTKRSITILMEPEVWNEEVVCALVGMGHTVKVIQSHGYDLIIGPRAWRLPKGKESLKDIGVCIKQACKLIREGVADLPAKLDIPMEVADVVEDTEITVQEEDGPVTERVISAYRPATRPGKKKQRTRTKISRGGYAATDQGDTEPGC